LPDLRLDQGGGRILQTDSKTADPVTAGGLTTEERMTQGVDS